ncbi:hypothetical protein LOTGIDRAFT_168649 [Lottia gigantea]|uniref:VWFD domain-containing protein n=1 Tax=Lottia gigantea TaxID=225164 RepID=V4B7K1_LOTGI|nr:hypothetical protein LOTGIDRAFT_168649 [Lottia gigantea]ESO84584.1 hypothetical protein LOTGIDRAFT_168649 [Lottia gigantea]
MVNVIFVCIGVLLVWGTVQSTDTCVKSGITDNQLSKAFYRADPDIKTGYLDVSVGWFSVSAVGSGVTLSYNNWLNQEHDARSEMINLWSHLTYMVVSNSFELYAHYEYYMLYSYGISHSLVDYRTVQELFDTACFNWNSVENTWPYGCFDADFFCHMSSALEKQENIVIDSHWDMRRYPPKLVEEMKTFKKDVEEYSVLGVDRYYRTATLKLYFEPEILKFIPESTQEDVFYRSKLTWMFIAKALEGDLNGFSYDLSEIESSGCTSLAGQPIATNYFCKIEEFKDKVSACAALSDVTPCIYDKNVQSYLTRGRFRDMEELELLHDMVSKTQDILTEFKDKVLANDRDGLNSLYNKFNPHVTVDDSMCVRDWPNAFDCTNNIACVPHNAPHKFDCNGEYTCRINMMYRFDCLLKFVLKQTKQLVDVAASGNWGRSEVIKAKNDLMIWLSYIPMARYTSLAGNEINDVIIDTQNTIKGYVTSYDTQGLDTFVSNLPHMSFVPQWAKDVACQQVSVSSEYTIFCNLDPLLNSVFLFIQAFENSKQSTTKILNPTINYRTLLDQLQLDRAAHLINVQTETISNQFRDEVQTNFQELSSYFSSLADYDKTKADADIAYIDGQLEVFKAKITSVSNSVEHKFTTILNLAIGSNVAELLQKTVKVGVALVSMANPIGKIIGDSSVLDFMDALNDLAQAGVTTAVIARLSDQEFPDLIQQAIDLGTKFADNEGQLGDARIFIDKMKDGEDAVETANDFLGKYNDYTPKVLLADITSFGAKWETVAEDLCEAAFSAESAGSALIEIGLASTGDCVNVGNEIEELITYYEELYEYQFDFMDSLSDAARAYLAYKKANDLKSAYTNTDSLNQAFLKQTAVNAFMVSTLNVWEVVTEYCDALTYTRGGEIPDKCETALRAPSHDAVAQVMSYTPDPLCHTNNEITDFRDIPTTPTNANDQGYIDLNALYARETVTFRIPNFQWLRDNGWFGPHDLEKAVYIKRFEVFLPPLSGQEEHLVEVEAQPGMANYLRPDGTNLRDKNVFFNSRISSLKCLVGVSDSVDLVVAKGHNLLCAGRI